MSCTAHEVLGLPAYRRITLPPIWAGSAPVDVALLSDPRGGGRLCRITPADTIEGASDVDSPIHHPNLLRVRGVKMADEGPVLLSDYNGGATLGELLQLGARSGPPMPTSVAVAIVLGACAALSAIHEHGSAHGALSPRTIHVGDDGIARLTDPRFERRMRRGSRRRRVELAYTAPERLAGEPPSIASDVFSMGVIAWEALAGRRLFRGETDADTTRKIVANPAPRLSRAAPFLGTQLDNILAKALEKEAFDRFDAIIGLSATIETMAARADWIADPEEVADYVQSVLGETVSRRRELLAELELEPITLPSADLGALLHPEPASQPTDFGSASDFAFDFAPDSASASAPASAPAPAPASASASARAPAHVAPGIELRRRFVPAERDSAPPRPEWQPTAPRYPDGHARPSFAPPPASVPPFVFQVAPQPRPNRRRFAIASLFTLGPVLALALVAWRSSVIAAPDAALQPIQVAAAHGAARTALAPPAEISHNVAPPQTAAAPLPPAPASTPARPAEAPRSGRSAAAPRAASTALAAPPSPQRRADARRPARPALETAPAPAIPAAEPPARDVPVNPYGL